MQFDPKSDYYKDLGVKENADAGEIKKAYRRLAKKYHPDSTGGDKAKETHFKRVSSAYDVLGDQDKRKQYDEFRTGPQLPPGFNFSGGGYGGSGFSGGQNINLGDLFSQVFSGAAAGQDHGRGGVRYESYPTGPRGPQQRDNRRSRRTGRRVRSDGANRQNNGQNSSPSLTRESRIKAPDGTTLTRKGNDIYSDVRIEFDHAVLGTVVEVSTMTGKAKVKIPPGTSSGAKLRLKEKGASSANGKRGDHYVTVQIDVPKTVDEKAKKLLVQFMKRTKRSK